MCTMKIALREQANAKYYERIGASLASLKAAEAEETRAHKARLAADKVYRAAMKASVEERDLEMKRIDAIEVE